MSPSLVPSEWKCLTVIALSHFTIVHWASGGGRELVLLIHRSLNYSVPVLSSFWEEKFLCHTEILDSELEQWLDGTLDCLPQSEWAIEGIEHGVARRADRGRLCIGHWCPSPLRSVLAMQLTVVNETWVKMTCHSRQKLLRANVCFATLLPAEKMTSSQQCSREKMFQKPGSCKEEKMLPSYSHHALGR